MPTGPRSLPDRQLRKASTAYLLTFRGSLPDRQLRNDSLATDWITMRSLPDRQLRKLSGTKLKNH